jgi:Na+/melibiose symporter-like transporter
VYQKVLSGFTTAALMFLNPMIVAEFVEALESKSPGECSPAQVQSVVSVVINVSGMVRGNINSFVLSLGDYKPGVEVQSESAINAILVLSYFIPAIAIVFSGIFIKDFTKDTKRD